jgi:GTP pyrophosphokinase
MLSDRFDAALVYASQLHREQLRKGSDTPYVAHLLGVASLVLEAGGTEEETIGALLHDAVEDQGGAPTREEIRVRFGEAIAAIVDGCTDTDETPKPPWRARKEKYLAHLPTASRSVLLVSSADKLHNARAILTDYRTLGELVWERFTGGREGSLWYYRTLVGVYRSLGGTPFVDELDRTVTELERLAAPAAPPVR